jgi:glycosyltransferase involved in cell wall biosynthesis
MKTTVLFLTKSDCWGGSEKHLLDFLFRINMSKVSPVILCMERDSYSKVLERNNLSIPVHSNMKYECFGDYLGGFRSFRPDIIVFVNSVLGLFPWTAYLAAKLAAGRVYAIEHLTPDDYLKGIPGRGFYNRMRRLVGLRARSRLRIFISGFLADKIICVSDAVRHNLIKFFGYPERRTVTIRNGIDLKYYSPFSKDYNKINSILSHLGMASTEDVIVCSCRITDQKDIGTLLNALEKLKADGMQFKCIIVGEGPKLQHYRKDTEERGLESSVFFVGHQEDIRPFLHLATIYVLPTKKEGLPLALLEAMACGLPCIATGVDGIPEVIDHQRNGLMITPGSEEELRKAIVHLLKNKEFREHIATQARKTVETHFDIEISFDRMQQIILTEF